MKKQHNINIILGKMLTLYAILILNPFPNLLIIKSIHEDNPSSVTKYLKE